MFLLEVMLMHARHARSTRLEGQFHHSEVNRIYIYLLVYIRIFIIGRRGGQRSPKEIEHIKGRTKSNHETRDKRCNDRARSV